MAAKGSTIEPAPKTVFVAILLIAVFVAAIIDIVIPINILDIANTFGALPGTVAQLDSLIAIASVATALLLAGFGARFRYKALVIIGLLFVAVFDLGLFLAPTFSVVQLIVPLNGIGSVMIIVAAQAFIGNSYAMDRKAKAIGWIAAAGTLANAVGSPIVGFVTGIGGWRSTFIWFMLPAAVASLFFVFLVFPNKLTERQMNSAREPFMRGLKQILTNKSAISCLLGAFLANASIFGSLVFEVTFLREIFSVSPGFAASIGPLAGAALVTLGAIIGGYMVNRVGRKRLTVVAIFFSGFFMMISYFLLEIVIFVGLRWLASFFIGVLAASASNLILEQVPMLRGTAMSLNSAFRGVGTAVGIAVAGVVLNLFVNPTMGFQALGLIVGALAFAGGFIYLFFARDPLRPSVSNQNT
jgi:predicted MFS family arabinose efflux permease